jgi:pimeloyl-ACP methyl ester carboxylesterase
VRDGYADSNGVRIHYATLGHGPLIVMIHGFPDFWYTWRDQMAALSHHYQVVAMRVRVGAVLTGCTLLMLAAGAVALRRRRARASR